MFVNSLLSYNELLGYVVMFVNALIISLQIHWEHLFGEGEGLPFIALALLMWLRIAPAPRASAEEAAALVMGSWERRQSGLECNIGVSTEQGDKSTEDGGEGC